MGLLSPIGVEEIVEIGRYVIVGTPGNQGHWKDDVVRHSGEG